MKLTGIVECRSIAQCRVQLADPSRDIWECHAYTFLGSGRADFDVQQYTFDGETVDSALAISSGPGLMELGEQYTYQLSEESPGLPMYCIEGGLRARLKSMDHPDAAYWFNSQLSLWMKSQALFKDKLYYLSIADK